MIALPLTIGEILDRSIRVCARDARSLFLPIVAVAGPFALAQLAVAPENFSSDLLFSRGGEHSAGASPAASIFRLIGSLLNQVELASAAFVAATLFGGSPPHIGAAVKRGFARLLPMLGVGLTYLFVGIPVWALAALWFYFFSISGPSLSALHLLAVGIGALAAIAVLLPFTLAATLSLAAVATETGSPFDAVEIGLRRTFGAGLFRRSLVAGLVFALVEGGAGVFEGLLGDGLDLLLHAPFISAVVCVPVDIALTGLSMVFIVGYFMDAQLRLDGGRAPMTIEAPA